MQQDKVPFHDHLVGFGCSSEIGQTFILLFGDAWLDEARCKSVNKDSGCVVGKVIK